MNISKDRLGKRSIVLSKLFITQCRLGMSIQGHKPQKPFDVLETGRGRQGLPRIRLIMTSVV